mgnify:CR=1 FL=1
MKQVLMTIALMALVMNGSGQGYEPGDRTMDFKLKNKEGTTG